MACGRKSICPSSQSIEMGGGGPELSADACLGPSTPHRPVGGTAGEERFVDAEAGGGPDGLISRRSVMVGRPSLWAKFGRRRVGVGSGFGVGVGDKGYQSCRCVRDVRETRKSGRRRGLSTAGQ